MTDHALSALVAIRICHDLASPVGAVANLADMLREDGDASSSDDLDLIFKTAERASCLLKLHRFVFGQSASDPEGVPITALRGHLAALETPGKVTVSVTSSADLLPADQARIAALLTLAGRSLVGLKGEVELALDVSGHTPFALRVNGPRCRISDTQQGLLVDASDLPSKASLLEFALLGQICAGEDRSIAVTEREGELGVSIGPQSSRSPPV
ncbi:MAG: hypothetical protein AAF317_12545 [Pseudomonadota bacterium]